jgi:predicted nucleic acid-binding protein
MISAPSNLFLRTADAVHLATAQEIGEREVWTNDRHMLAASSWFGLTGRSAGEVDG